MSFMQGKSVGLPPMLGTTFALHPALWGRYTLTSLPKPCSDHQIEKWQFHEFASTLHSAVSVFGHAAMVRNLLDAHCIDGNCDTVLLKKTLNSPALGSAANQGIRPLDLAAGSGHVEISELL